VKILNAPVSPAFRESVRYGEQNLYHAGEGVSRRPRPSRARVLRAIAGTGLRHVWTRRGLAVLMTLCSGLIERSVKGGLIVVGALNLGGSVEMIANPVAVAELAVEKGATTLLMPISARKQLLICRTRWRRKSASSFYADSKDAFLKALVE